LERLLHCALVFLDQYARDARMIGASYTLSGTEKKGNFSVALSVVRRANLPPRGVNP
jgi:hypothetical protein